MDKKNFIQSIKSGELAIPRIKEGMKISGTVVKKIINGVLINCEGGAFSAVILQKEVKDLARQQIELIPWAEIEAEVISTDIRHDEWYYIISISKLKQYDVRQNIMEKIDSDEVLTVTPTEANLWGLLVDMHGIKWFIPLSQLSPIHYPRVEDGDQERIFSKLLDLIWIEIKVRVQSIDEDERRVILSEREALKEETDKIMAEIAVGKNYKGVISGISSYGFFVTVWGSVEGLVHISELTFGHVQNIDRLGKVWDAAEVKVIGLDNDKISLSIKQLKPDPWSIIPKSFKQGDIIRGEVVRFVPYGVFVRMYEDINGLIHLSELSQKQVSNPSEIVKLGQVVEAKVILLDVPRRKIGLSMKTLEEGAPEPRPRKPRPPRPPRTEKPTEEKKPEAKTEPKEKKTEEKKESAE